MFLSQYTVYCMGAHARNCNPCHGIMFCGMCKLTIMKEITDWWKAIQVTMRRYYREPAKTEARYQTWNRQYKTYDGSGPLCDFRCTFVAATVLYPIP